MAKTYRRSDLLRVGALVAADLCCFSLMVFLALFVYQLFGAAYTLEDYTGFWPFPLLAVLCNGFIRLYHGNAFYPGAALPAVEELRRSFFSISLSYVLLFAYLTLTRTSHEYSRLALLLGWVLTLLMFPIFRWAARCLLKDCGIGQIPVLIAGAGRTGTLVAAEFSRDKHFGFETVGFLDDAREKLPPAIDGVPVLGTLDQAVEIAKQNHVNYLICCLPVQIISKLVREYSRYFRHILIIPDNDVFSTSWAYPINLSGFPALELSNQLLFAMPRYCKAAFEAVISISAIIVLLPLFLVLAVLVKCTSRGPVFYRAKRLGRNGAPIEVLKFRTMYMDAEAQLQKMLDANPDLAREWREKFKLDRDPRITPLGNFLRRSSLDELPQFWNVLRGDMAVIGPRPIVQAEVAYYAKNYDLMKRVKPGITGLWQVSGRSELDYTSRVRLDMNYILNWSIWLDYYIFLKTIKEVVAGRGAK